MKKGESENTPTKVEVFCFPLKTDLDNRIVVIGFDSDVLVVITKFFTEQCHAATVGCILGNGEGKVDGAVIVNM